MHPTADTAALMFDNVAGRRVMPGVMRLPVEEERNVIVRQASNVTGRAYVWRVR
jgi:hypothetical protein